MPQTALNNNLAAENAALRARLAEAEDLLSALRRGEIDALLMQSDGAPQVFTLQGVDGASNRARGEMLEIIGDAVIALDGEHRVSYLNPAARRLFSLDASTALGSVLSEVPELRALNHLIAGDELGSGDWLKETIEVGAEGKKRILEASAMLPGGRESAQGILVTCRDITERYAAGEAMRLSEIRYRRLFEAAHDGVLILDPRTRKIIDANPFMTALLSYTHQQMIGKELYEIGFLADARASRDMFQNLKAVGQVRYESLPLRNQDGNVREVEVVANLYDENGHSVIQCNVRDITERKRTESRLQLSEAKLRLGLEVAVTGLGAIDYQEGTITLDKTAASLFALPENQPIPRADLHARFHPEDSESIFAKMAEALKPTGNGDMAVDHRIVRPDHSVIWVSARKQIAFSKAPDGMSAPLSGLLAVQDITNRKQAEEALRISESRLRAYLTATTDAVYRMSPDWSEMLQLSGGGFIVDTEHPSKSWLTEYIDPDDQHYVLTAISQAIEAKSIFDLEHRVKRTDGRLGWTRSRAIPILDEWGAVVEWLGAASDVTERKQTETELRQSHDTYLSLIENNPFGVYLVDADFRLAQISPSVQAAFGSIHPLLGRDFAEIVKILWREPVAGEIFARFRHTLETGEGFHSKDTTGERANKDAEESYDWQIERVRLPGGRFGVVCYFYDLTERKHHEQQIQFLMGEVNHRAKNLLAVVQAIAQQTARSADPSTFVIHLSERIRGLAASQDLLVKNQWTHIAMSELVHAQLSPFTDLFGARVLLDGPPINLSPSAAQGLGMALHELATNAVKYGALSNASGRVHINWDHVAAAKPGFMVQWLEEGGPEVAPPNRTGFGNTVIRRMVEASVEGAVEVEYRKSGLYWKLTAPLAKLLEDEDRE